MTGRREFLLAMAAGPFVAKAQAAPSLKLGIDVFSLRAKKWTPIQFLDYCASQQVQVVHFSEIRFLGSLEPSNLKSVRERAAQAGIEVEIGMRSICPSSKMFDKAQGTAEQQLTRMIDAAVLVGSKIVRAVLGSADDRTTPSIQAHIDDTVRVLRKVRSKAVDSNIKIAIENHAGDMQARELKGLIEQSGPDFVGVCLDSGNPLWTLEDPMFTLETLHPYVLTSHLRDSAVWNVPEGTAVTWVTMGRGNVNIDGYVKRFIELCPGRPLSLESIVFGPKILAYKHPDFWNAYRDVRAWEFERYVQLAERGQPAAAEPWEAADEPDREQKALEESLGYLKKLVGSRA